MSSLACEAHLSKGSLSSVLIKHLTGVAHISQLSLSFLGTDRLRTRTFCDQKGEMASLCPVAEVLMDGTQGSPLAPSHSSCSRGICIKALLLCSLETITAALL